MAKKQGKFKASPESHGTMGDWKKHKILKAGRRSFTRSTPGRIYIAIPPPEGWPGGDPEKNGYRRKSQK